ncbi:MAG: molybdopterin molybdotransferase MoeA [Giesbergeria sp.]
MNRLDQIAASLQGFNPQALSAAQVSQFLEQLVEPVQEHETVALHTALGRVLAADVVSPLSVPPHDNSAMDGFAFDGAQLQPNQSLRLQVVGTALAGTAWHGTAKNGECVRIMTGAVMPAGLDTVAPQELTQMDGEYITLAANLLHAGDNRRFAGEDLMQGAVALAAGELVTPAALGLFASLGLAQVPVLRRLRVAYFSTGNEILSPGEPPREGAVYDSNRFALLGLLTRLGVEPIDLGVVRDDPALLREAFASAAAQADAVITSGGVSVGDADHTRSLMRELGDVAFWQIAMRPGRPMAVGRITGTKTLAKTASNACTEGANSSLFNSESTTGDAVLFGLPGNPVAVMVTFLAFVRPALLRMMGCTRPAPPLLRARSSTPIRKKPGRTEYQRGWVGTGADGQLEVCVASNQGSGVLSSMVRANGLVVLPHSSGNVAPGDMVEIMVFDGVM